MNTQSIWRSSVDGSVRGMLHLAEHNYGRPAQEHGQNVGLQPNACSQCARNRGLKSMRAAVVCVWPSMMYMARDFGRFERALQHRSC